MDPFTAAAIIAGGTQIVGGIIGGNAAAAEAEKANALLDAAIERINALEIPDLTKEIIYQQMMATGDFTPQRLEKTIEEFAPVALIKEDPVHKIRQEATYAQVQQIAQTGVSPQQKLALEKSRREAARNALAEMISIESKAKQRGQFGSGEMLTLQALAAQGQADRESMRGMEAAAVAGQNQLNALKSQADIERDMRARDFETIEKNVSSKNLRDEMLMKYSTHRSEQNFLENIRKQQQMNEALQKAQEYNIKTANAEALRRGHDAKLQDFNMRLKKESALGNLYGSKADVHMKRGQAKAKMISDIAGGVGNLATAGAGMFGGGETAAATAGSGGGWQANPLGGQNLQFTSSLNPNDFMSTAQSVGSSSSSFNPSNFASLYKSTQSSLAEPWKSPQKMSSSVYDDDEDDWLK